MQILSRCRAGLGRLVDVDAMLQQFSATPRTATPRTCRSTIDNLIALKHTLQQVRRAALTILSIPHSSLSSPRPPVQLPTLTSALQDAVNPLLRAIAGNMAAPALGAVADLIAEVLTEDTTWARTPLQMRQQECFAVKPGIDGNLDAVRKVRYTQGLTVRHSTAPRQASAGVHGLQCGDARARGGVPHHVGGAHVEAALHNQPRFSPGRTGYHAGVFHP